MNYGSKLAVLACARFLVCNVAAAQTPTPAPAKKPSTAAKAPAKAPVRTTPYDPALLHPETLKLKAPAEYDVKFVTTAGEFTIKVTRSWAPNGADRFYNLVRHHFYDGAAFFRVLPGFMAQFGMSAYPEVSKAWDHARSRTIPSRRATSADSSHSPWRDPIRARRRSSSIWQQRRAGQERIFSIRGGH